MVSIHRQYTDCCSACVYVRLGSSWRRELAAQSKTARLEGDQLSAPSCPLFAGSPLSIVAASPRLSVRSGRATSHSTSGTHESPEPAARQLQPRPGSISGPRHVSTDNPNPGLPPRSMRYHCRALTAGNDPNRLGGRYLRIRHRDSAKAPRHHPHTAGGRLRRPLLHLRGLPARRGLTVRATGYADMFTLSTLHHLPVVATTLALVVSSVSADLAASVNRGRAAPMAVEGYTADGASGGSTPASPVVAGAPEATTTPSGEGETARADGLDVQAAERH